MAKSKIEGELDRLYAGPLEDFTATRDEIAGDLRERGSGDDADEVKRLRKPTVPAWAINQAVRRSAKGSAELTKAGTALRKAQEGLSGKGGRDRFRTAQQRVRDAVRELRREAEAALGGGGRPASAAVSDQIEQTLTAAALDPDTGEQVTGGRLERPDVAVGFPGVAPSGAPPSRARKGDGGADRARKALEKRLGREEERLAEATEKREAAEAVLEDAERAAEAAAKELERAKRKRDAEAKREAAASEKVEGLRAEL